MTTKLHLRPTTPADLAFVVTAEQHPQNRQFIGSWSQEQHLAACTNPDLRHCIVVRSDDHHPVGYLILAGVTNPHRSVELVRIVITEPGNGYGHTTMRLVQAMVFQQLNAHRLWLDVKQQNTRARQLYQRHGFVEEGMLREAFRGDQGYESLIIMAILAHEYQP